VRLRYRRFILLALASPFAGSIPGEKNAGDPNDSEELGFLKILDGYRRDKGFRRGSSLTSHARFRAHSEDVGRYGYLDRNPAESSCFPTGFEPGLGCPARTMTARSPTGPRAPPSVTRAPGKASGLVVPPSATTATRSTFNQKVGGIARVDVPGRTAGTGRRVWDPGSILPPRREPSPSGQGVSGSEHAQEGARAHEDKVPTWMGQRRERFERWGRRAASKER
jgi:hypothetical protein